MKAKFPLKLIVIAVFLELFTPTAYGQIFKSKQTKRHKKYITTPSTAITDSRSGSVEYVVSIQTPSSSSPKPPKTFFDLSPDVQKELIKRLGFLEENGNGLMDQLKKNFSSKPSQGVEVPIEVIDMTEVKKQIITGIYNRSLFPADRIYRFDITIKTASTEVYFTSCDAIITKYETLEIAKQTQTTNIGFDAGGNAGNTVVSKNGSSESNINGWEETDGSENDKTTKKRSNTGNNNTSNNRGIEATTGLGVNAKFNASRSRTEEGSLRQRYVALSGNVLEKGVRLYSESISGIDLTGNIIAEVSFRFSSITSDYFYGFDKLYKPDGSPETPGAINVKPKFVIYPDINNDVKMENINATAVLRAVVKNQSTIMEGDDNIAMLQYKDITTAECPILVTKREVVPTKYVIKTAHGYLRIRPLSNQPTASSILYFSSSYEARAFVEWLKESKTQVISSNGILQSGKYKLLSDEADFGGFIDNCNVVKI